MQKKAETIKANLVKDTLEILETLFKEGKTVTYYTQIADGYEEYKFKDSSLIMNGPYASFANECMEDILYNNLITIGVESDLGVKYSFEQLREHMTFSMAARILDALA